MKNPHRCITATILSFIFLICTLLVRYPGFTRLLLTGPNSTVHQVHTKYVLVWAPRWYGVKVSSLDFKRKPSEHYKGCPVSNCAMTDDRSKLGGVDAVLFVMTDMGPHDFPDPKQRKGHQHYIFYLEESPSTTQEIWHPSRWNLPDFFNLTFTYRLDSDIFSDDYVDKYKPHLIDISKRETSWFTKKRGILWMVSHCKTANKREDYVDELTKHVKVDIAGQCKPNIRNPCPRNSCSNMTFLAEYKFYLAFENSMCKEYVTEKLFNALNNDVVPIVMGGARYNILLPGKAVINVEDYSSPRALADHLNYLSNNQTAYEEHLSWKYEGKALWKLQGGFPAQGGSGFCKICEILHQSSDNHIRKSYHNILDWLLPNQCRSPFEKVHYNVSDYNATFIFG